MSKIFIDFEKEIGVVKNMHAVNNTPASYNKNDYKRARIPYARNHDAALYEMYGANHVVDIYAIFPDFHADENDPASYDFLLTDNYIKNAREVGTEVFFRLGTKIENYAKKYTIFPPEDFGKWARICEHIVRHYNAGWADGYEFGLTYWEIWNEPDLDEGAPVRRTWGGTREEYYDLYATTAKYLKACFPDIKVGGPALALSTTLDWAEGFVDYVKRENAPLDFFSWHRYDHTDVVIPELCRTFRKMLDERGFTKTESILDEWNYVKSWEKSDEYRRAIIGIKGAVFTAANMLRCQNEPVDMLMYYDVRPSVWSGVFDIYTGEKLKGYYPFLMWSKLKELGTQVALSTDDERIAAVAAKGQGKGAVMLTYYDDAENGKSKEVTLHVQGLTVRSLASFPLTAYLDADALPLPTSDTVTFTLYPNTVNFLLYNDVSLDAGE